MKTPPPETVPYEKFEIEKNAKNKAYDFILSRGYFEDWVSFNKSYQGDAHNNCINILKSNIMEKVTKYSPLSKERQRSAISFIENLSDPDNLRCVLDSVSDINRNLINKANEAYGNEEEQAELISQLCYLTNITDALIYIGTHDVLKKEE